MYIYNIRYRALRVGCDWALILLSDFCPPTFAYCLYQGPLDLEGHEISNLPSTWAALENHRFC